MQDEELEDIQVIDFKAEKKKKKKDTKDDKDKKDKEKKDKKKKEKDDSIVSLNLEPEKVEEKVEEAVSVQKDAQNTAETETMDEKPQVEEIKFDNPYTYEFLLGRVSDIMNLNKTYASRIVQITIEKAGKYKFYWTKFKEFCQGLNRSPEHFASYLAVELSISAIPTDEKLVIEGRKIDQKKVEEVTRKYVNEYIKCPNCKSTNTTMAKNPNSRMFVMHCQDCHSKHTVSTIRATGGAKK